MTSLQMLRLDMVSVALGQARGKRLRPYCTSKAPKGTKLHLAATPRYDLGTCADRIIESAPHRG